MTELRHLPDDASVYACWEGGACEFTKAELRETLKLPEPFDPDDPDDGTMEMLYDSVTRNIRKPWSPRRRDT